MSSSTPARLIELAQVEGSVEVIDGMPRPQWDKIGAWIGKHIRKSHHVAAWSEAAFQWLERLAVHLGEPYWVGCSDECALLTSQSKANATELLRASESLLTGARHTFGPPNEEFLGPHVIIVFDDLATYVDYVCYFFPDGEYGALDGVCIRGDYVHIALPVIEQRNPLELPELSRAMYLALLLLPRWIEEGANQPMMQHRRQRSVDSERALKHSNYWRESGLDTFWSGEAFDRTGEAGAMAFELAEILIQNLMSDHDRFRVFLSRAKPDDHGARAAQDTFGLTLAEIVTGFLGKDV